MVSFRKLEEKTQCLCTILFWLKSYMYEGLCQTLHTCKRLRPHNSSCGDKCLNSEKSSQLCSKSIVDLAKSLKSGKRKVTISGIIPRNDEWNNKAAEVNEY